MRFVAVRHVLAEISIPCKEARALPYAQAQHFLNGEESAYDQREWAALDSEKGGQPSTQEEWPVLDPMRMVPFIFLWR